VSINKAAILKAKALSIKTTLAKASEEAKGHRVTRLMAGEFNGLLDQVKTECPEVAFALPQPITSHHMPFAGVSDATYIDLEILTEQLISILEAVDASK
jgi:hypothetical protein